MDSRRFMERVSSKWHCVASYCRRTKSGGLNLSWPYSIKGIPKFLQPHVNLSSTNVRGIKGFSYPVYFASSSPTSKIRRYSDSQYHDVTNWLLLICTFSPLFVIFSGKIWTPLSSLWQVWAVGYESKRFKDKGWNVTGSDYVQANIRSVKASSF